MTNLEWIKTLSEEEFADWLYDEWLHHLQYRWSSSRGGLIIWLKDRKTENSSEKPNNSKVSEKLTGSTRSKMEQVDKDINVRSKDEPQKKEVEWVYNKRERLWYPYSNGELLFKDEPTTQTETQNSNLTFEKVMEEIQTQVIEFPDTHQKFTFARKIEMDGDSIKIGGWEYKGVKDGEREGECIECHYEPTISKMEQVDKDINVRSKDEPQTCSVNGRPYDCGNCEYFRCTADEPQTERSSE